jgi:hypothetical protein
MTPNELFVMRAQRIRGPAVEKGFALLCKGCLVFAPSGGKARAVSGHVSGVMPQAFHDVPAYVAYLEGLEPAQFESTLAEAIRHGGWSRIPVGKAKVVRKRALFRRHRVFVSFDTGTDTIQFDGPVDPARLPEVDEMLASWS